MELLRPWCASLLVSAVVASAAAVLDRTESYMLATRAARQQLARKSGKAMNEIANEPPPPERVARVLAEIEDERVPLVRQARWFEYLSLVFLGSTPEPELTRRGLQELGPRSPSWPLFYGNVLGRVPLSTDAPSASVKFATDVVDAQPSKALKANVAGGVISTLADNGRIGLAQTLMDKARAEFGDQPLAKAVLAQYGANRNLQPENLCRRLALPRSISRIPFIRNPGLKDACT